MNERSATSHTVLVVDDSPVILEMTRALLEAEGLRVVTRARGAGTVEAVIRDKPDLVLLDVKMPRFNGDTIATILKRSALERRTIVLLYSSYPADVLEQKVQEAGADGYIQKTDDPMDLVNQVNRWLKRSSRQVSQASTSTSASALSAVSPAVQSSVPTSTGRFRKTPLVLFVDDDAFTLAAYRRVQSRAEFTGEFVTSSSEALDKILSPDAPDVVVCDVFMPNPDGRQLFERAVRQDSSWRRRFVFVTGAGSMGHLTTFLETVRQQVLYKPVEFEALTQAVRFASIAARVLSTSPETEWRPTSIGPLARIDRGGSR